MIDAKILNKLFDESDRELRALGQFRVITINGGAALIHLGLIHRATYDIDIFSPQIDSHLKSVFMTVGQNNKLGPYWINSTGKAFIKELPSGWEERRQVIFKGQNLEVFHLGRKDLIFTKLLAELDRQEDYEDIIGLRPTKMELKSAEKHLLPLDSSEEWKSQVKKLIGQILGQSE